MCASPLDPDFQTYEGSVSAAHLPTIVLMQQNSTWKYMP